MAPANKQSAATGKVTPTLFNHLSSPPACAQKGTLHGKKVTFHKASQPAAPSRPRFKSTSGSSGDGNSTLAFLKPSNHHHTKTASYITPGSETYKKRAESAKIGNLFKKTEIKAALDLIHLSPDEIHFAIENALEQLKLLNFTHRPFNECLSESEREQALATGLLYWHFSQPPYDTLTANHPPLSAHIAEGRERYQDLFNVFDAVSDHLRCSINMDEQPSTLLQALRCLKGTVQRSSLMPLMLKNDQSLNSDSEHHRHHLIEHLNNIKTMLSNVGVPIQSERIQKVVNETTVDLPLKTIGYNFSPVYSAHQDVALCWFEPNHSTDTLTDMAKGSIHLSHQRLIGKAPTSEEAVTALFIQSCEKAEGVLEFVSQEQLPQDRKNGMNGPAPGHSIIDFLKAQQSQLTSSDHPVLMGPYQLMTIEELPLAGYFPLETSALIVKIKNGRGDEMVIPFVTAVHPEERLSAHALKAGIQIEDRMKRLATLPTRRLLNRNPPIVISRGSELQAEQYAVAFEHNRWAQTTLSNIIADTQRVQESEAFIDQIESPHENAKLNIDNDNALRTRISDSERRSIQTIRLRLLNHRLAINVSRSRLIMQMAHITQNIPNLIMDPRAFAALLEYQALTQLNTLDQMKNNGSEDIKLL